MLVNLKNLVDGRIIVTAPKITLYVIFTLNTVILANLFGILVWDCDNLHWVCI